MKNIFIIIMSIVLTGCNYPNIEKIENGESIFLKVNVEIEGKNQKFYGYSINEYKQRCGYSTNGKNCIFMQSSEAVAIDLPNKRTIYALISRNGDYEWLLSAPSSAFYLSKEHPGKKFFKKEWMPDFVFFDNDGIPSSVSFINPDEYFLEGFKIKNVYIERHKGPRKKDVLNRLKWSKYLIGSLSGNPMTSLVSKTDADRLNRNSFLKEDF